MCSMEAYVAARVFQSYNAYQTDKAKAKNINDTATANAERLRNEAIYTDNSLIRSQESEKDKAAFQKEQVQEKKLLTEGTAKVAFFERGLGGNLYNTILGDIARQGAKQFNTIDLNYENKLRQITDERLMYNRKYTNQIISLPRAYKPSFMTYALETAVDIGGMYAMNKAPSTPKASTYDGASSMSAYMKNPTGYSGSS